MFFYLIIKCYHLVMNIISVLSSEIASQHKLFLLQIIREFFRTVTRNSSQLFGRQPPFSPETTHFSTASESWKSQSANGRTVIRALFYKIIFRYLPVSIQKCGFVNPYVPTLFVLTEGQQTCIYSRVEQINEHFLKNNIVRYIHK